jgi:hypothetical protein
MKKIVLLFSLSVLLMISCSDGKNEDELNRDIVFQMLVSVYWQIDLFSDSEEVRTSEFSAYTFDFLPTNKVTANDGTNVYEGIWYVLDNNNSDSEAGLTVHIAFETPENFTGLSNDWAIISANQQMVRLQYSGGEITEYLTFSQKVK